MKTTFDTTGLRVLIVRPGSTELDEQGRIAGTLDVPLSRQGQDQIRQLANELSEFDIGRIVAGPGSASMETARIIAENAGAKVKIDDGLANLDYGLWHGKRIEELKENQPKLFRLWQEQPDSVCPPNGESTDQLINRVQQFCRKLTRKPKSESVVVIAAEPVACVLRSVLEGANNSLKYWTIEPRSGTCDSISPTVMADSR